jgi:hypothetical protein
MLEIQRLNPHSDEVRKKFLALVRDLTELEYDQFKKKINDSFEKLSKTYEK